MVHEGQNSHKSLVEMALNLILGRNRSFCPPLSAKFQHILDLGASALILIENGISVNPYIITQTCEEN